MARRGRWGWWAWAWVVAAAGCDPGSVAVPGPADPSTSTAPTAPTGGIVAIPIPTWEPKSINDGIVLSPHGERLALPGHDGSVDVLDVAAQRFETLRPAGSGSVWAGPAAFSASGSLLAVAHDNREILIWEVAGPRLLRLIPIDPPAGVIAPRFVDGDRSLQALLAISQDTGNKFDFLEDYSTARWDVATGERREGDRLGIYQITLTVAPDGRHGVVGDRRGQPGLVDFASGRVVAELGDANGNAIFTPDGATLIVVQRDWAIRGTLAFRDVATGRERRRLAIDPDFCPFDRQLALSADARLLAVGGYPRANSAAVLDLATGRVLGAVPSGPAGSNCGHIALSADGRTLATITGAADYRDQPVTPELKLWRLPAEW